MIQLKSDKTWSQLYSFKLISFGRQMATFADNSVANFFFHSPWRPKWSQLGALRRVFAMVSPRREKKEAKIKLLPPKLPMNPACSYHKYIHSPETRTFPWFNLGLLAQFTKWLKANRASFILLLSCDFDDDFEQPKWIFKVHLTPKIFSLK